MTTFQSTVIEPLKPDIVDEAYLNLNKALLLSTAGQQFYELLPLFTCLLVGAGMLLLALLLILLASERRAELGMSRAVGLQRAHLVQLLLFEGVGNGIVAVVLGVPLGLCAIALELGLLGILSHTPVFSAADPNTVSTPVLLPLHVWLSWQSLVSTCCLSLLTILLAVLLTACWISRTNIVTAIRDLDDSPARRFPLMHALHALRHPPVDAAGQPIQETLAGRFSRRMEAVSSLLWGTWVRGPLCLLGGGVLLALADASEQLWLEQLSGAVGLAGLGLLVRWVLELCPLSWLTPALARRVGVSFIGLGWLVLGLQSGGPFLALFEPFDGVAPPPSALEMLLILLLPVGGMVVLIFTNADLLAALCTFLFRRLRDLAPVSRTSLAYPLTFRFRTGVTMVLLSLVTFLVLLLVTTNLGALQEAQSAASTGGFQLEADILSDEQPQLAPSPQIRAIQSHRLLAQDFSAVGLLRLLYQPTGLLLGSQIRLDLASQSSYTTPYRTALVADDGFLSNTTLSMSARARGYTSDQQVWNAVKDHPGYAVLRYQSHLGLPTSDGFAPFTAEVPDGSTSSAHYHQVTVIGILPSGTHWQAIFLSQRTAAEIIQPPYTGYNFYFFRMQPGVSIAQASRDLDRALSADQPVIQVLGDASLLNNTAITEVLTLFLGGYLALGLLFGALSIGVIASRAVVERRQQIGMLCALGFSRTLVRRSFLIEAGFVITLSVLVGASLALWLAYQVALLVYHDQFPVPVLPIVLILSGSYAVAFVATLLPARQAARLHPAEALRYE